MRRKAMSQKAVSRGAWVGVVVVIVLMIVAIVQGRARSETKPVPAIGYQLTE
jgi:hypothetical protein